MLNYLYHPTTVTWSIHLVLAFLLSLRVIMKRPATGVALAWLFVINALPIVGELVYLLIGERRISWSRQAGLRQIRSDFAEAIELAGQKGMLTVDWKKNGELARSMGELGWNLVGSPTVHGSNYELLGDTEEILQRIANDIDEAKQSVLMEFYIWNRGAWQTKCLLQLSVLRNAV